MRKTLFSKLCLYALASTVLLLSTLKYAMADYSLANGCVFSVCTGTGYVNNGYCSRLMCENQLCKDSAANPEGWAVYASSSQVYRNPQTNVTCMGNFQSGYSNTGQCCGPSGN